jgi:hypothetical protein
VICRLVSLKTAAKKKVSSDSASCTDSCNSGEYYTSVAGKSYKQCVSCTKEAPIPKADNSGCGLCEGNKIADIESHTCLDSFSKCEPPKVVFTDLKRCGAKCPELYIKNVDNYTLCSKTCKYLDEETGYCTETCALVDLVVAHTANTRSRILGNEY